jgi:hypothetical protein
MTLLFFKQGSLMPVSMNQAMWPLIVVNNIEKMLERMVGKIETYGAFPHHYYTPPPPHLPPSCSA